MSGVRKAHTLTAVVCEEGEVHLRLHDRNDKVFAEAILSPTSYTKVDEIICRDLQRWIDARKNAPPEAGHA